MKGELPKTYNHTETEDKIYRLWEKSGFFNPDVCVKKGVTKKNAKPFSMVLPPPNVTGTLHMGHAAMLAIEDILARYHRMRGDKTLWLPGTDHASIATESKVEQLLLKSEGKTRHDLGREAFLERVNTFAQESHDTIVRQVKKMGASLDWSREAYTLDEPRTLAVRAAFKLLYDQGLIYQGERIVNWDPKLQTTVSDDEIEWQDEQTDFYELRYGPFIIGTTRPETKFGDKYVVVHPKDARYEQYSHGQQIQTEWLNGPVTATVIKDSAIDMKFGTGAMTITPWHDKTDFDIAERHGLKKEQIIDLKGKLLPIAGEYSGTHIAKARPLIVEKLKQKGLLKEIKQGYQHRVATNSRGGGIIEPQIMRQWFIDVNKEFLFHHAGLKTAKKGQKTTLKKLMHGVVKNKEIDIIPKRFEKIYFHWIANLHDWCISRQIWFGHRLPVYYCTQENTKFETLNSPQVQNSKFQNRQFFVSIEEPKKCLLCGVCKPEQEQDTLDTWFSAGLWTFSTLGWPRALSRGKSAKGSDFRIYHPTSVLETGYDILFFWVARMILMSTVLAGQIPFKTVYLHGLVRDEKGRKMSKSLGNIIDPVDMIAKYGADAARLSLIIGAAPGNDMKISDDKIRGYRNFSNKLWNIARFVLLNMEGFQDGKKARLSLQDKKILKDFAEVMKKTTARVEAYQFSRAADSMYHYLWHTFADKILEQSKTALADSKLKQSRQYTLLAILRDSLKILHPFMPFVTEALYQQLPLKHKQPTLMIEHWPV